MSSGQEIVSAMLLSPSRGFYYRLVVDNNIGKVFLLDTNDPDVKKLVDDELGIDPSEAMSRISECQVVAFPPITREYNIEEEEEELPDRGLVYKIAKLLIALSERLGKKQRMVRYRQSRTILGLGHVEQCNGHVRIIPEKCRELTRIVTVLNFGPREARSIHDLVSYAMSDGCPTTVLMFLIPDVTARPYTLYRITNVTDIPETLYAEPNAFKFEDASILSYTDPITGVQHHVIVGRVEVMKDDVTGRTYAVLVPYINRSTFHNIIVGTSLYRSLVGDLLKLREVVHSIEKLVDTAKNSGADPNLVKKLDDLLNYVKSRFDQLADAVAMMSRPMMLTIESLRTFMSNIMQGLARIGELYGDVYVSEFIALLEESTRRSGLARILGDLTTFRNIIMLEQLAQRPLQAQPATAQVMTLPSASQQVSIGQSMLAFQPPPHLPQVQQQLQQALQIAQATQQTQTQQQDIATLLARISLKLDELGERVSKLEKRVEELRTGAETEFAPIPRKPEHI